MSKLSFVWGCSSRQHPGSIVMIMNLTLVVAGLVDTILRLEDQVQESGVRSLGFRITRWVVLEHIVFIVLVLGAL